MKKQYQDLTSRPLHLIFIVATVMTVVAAFILALIYSKLLAHAAPLDPSLIILDYRDGLMPKPRERFVFLVLAIAVPAIASITSFIVFKSIHDRCKLGLNWQNPRENFSPILLKDWVIFLKTNLPIWLKQGLMIPHPAVRAFFHKSIRTNGLLCWEWINHHLTGILVFITVALIYYPFIGFDFSQALLTEVRLPSEHPLMVLFMTFVIAAGWYIWQLSKRNGFMVLKPSRLSVAFAWVIFGVFVVLQMGAWRILSETSMTQADRWRGHADIVFYGISQVMAGKTLLVDLPSQYGLYPELLKPIFKLTGLSILSFTVLSAILQVLSLSAVFWVVQRSVRDHVIRILFATAFAMVTFGTVVWLIGLGDPYYQYWPIRFFWPAMAVLGVYRYSQRPTLFRAFQVSLIGSIGTIWNMDTGLMMVIAFAGVLVLKWIVLWSSGGRALKNQQSQLCYALLIHLGTFVMVVLLMWGYLCLKGGGAIHWDWLFGYQKLFYGLGFMMMPLPLHPYPWMSILGIYLIALMVAIRSWTFNPHARHADVLSFTSMLGLGLFIYYEGRAHSLNLITVCWPALVLIAMLADRVLRAVRMGLLSRQHVLFPIAAASVLLFCSIPLVLSSVKLAKQTITAFEQRNKPADQLVSEELSFIRMHAKPGDECVMLTRRQGLYYAEAGIGSPIPGPGYIEMILQKDRDVFLENLSQQRFACIFVGVVHPLRIADYWYPIVSQLVAKLHGSSTAAQQREYDPKAWIKSGNGETSALKLGVDPMQLLQDYEIVARSAHGSMLYMKPKNSLELTSRHDSATTQQQITPLNWLCLVWQIAAAHPAFFDALASAGTWTLS